MKHFAPYSLILSLVFSVLLPNFAVAAEEEEVIEDVDNRPTVVQVPVVLMPITDNLGNLRKYAYLLIELTIPRANDRWSVEERIPLIKDSFVRELHTRNNLEIAPGKIDENQLRDRLSARIQKLFPDGRVGEIVFRDIALP